MADLRGSSTACFSVLRIAFSYTNGSADVTCKSLDSTNLPEQLLTINLDANLVNIMFAV